MERFLIFVQVCSKNKYHFKHEKEHISLNIFLQLYLKSFFNYNTYLLLQSSVTLIIYLVLDGE